MPARALLFFVLVIFLHAGCDETGVQTHEVPKGVERAILSAPEPDPGTDQSSDVRASDPGRPWTVPDGWTEDPEPRQMRLATYLAPNAGDPVEVAVTRFAGRVGGELANINRWRGQMGLPPIDESELGAAITRFSSPGFEGYEARIAGPGGVMLTSGVYDEAIDQTWFVRAMVPDDEVADRLETDLFAMARSIASNADEGGN